MNVSEIINSISVLVLVCGAVAFCILVLYWNR